MPATFLPSHHALTQSKTSPWVNRFVIRRRDSQCSYALRGLVYSERRNPTVQQQIIDTMGPWLELLSDQFYEPLTAYDSRAKAALFDQVYAAQRKGLDGLDE